MQSKYAYLITIMLIFVASAQIGMQKTSEMVYAHELVHKQIFEEYGIDSEIELFPETINFGFFTYTYYLTGATYGNKTQLEDLPKAMQKEVMVKHLELHEKDYPRQHFYRGIFLLMFMIILSIIAGFVFLAKRQEELVLTSNIRNNVQLDIYNIRKEIYGTKSLENSSKSFLPLLQEGNKKLAKSRK